MSDMIAEAFEWWDDGDRESEDEYARFYVRAEFKIAAYPWGTERKIEDIALYIHEPSGLVVRDPRAFEEWRRKA